MKSNSRLSLCLLVVISLVIHRCSTENSLSGTAGSETVNTFTLTVLDKENQPVCGASVRLIENDLWLRNICENKSVIYYNAVTGSDGAVKIPYDSFPASDINLLIDSGNSALFYPSFKIAKSSNGTCDTVTLETAAALSGSLTLSTPFPVKIMLHGTDYSQDMDPDDGSFDFSSVAPGLYKILIREDTQSFTCAGIDKVELLEGEHFRTQLAVDFSGTLVDHFDGDVNLMSFLNSGQWYITRSPNVSVYFPAERETDTLYIPLRSALVSEGAYDGNSVYVNYNIGGGSSYLIIGAQVSSMEAGFTHIDTVSFMAKGNGKLNVRIHGLESNNMPQAICSVDLDTVWQRFTITSDQYFISDPQGTLAGWEEIRGRLQWIAFHPGSDGSEFWLDDVRLEGVTLDELILP